MKLLDLAIALRILNLYAHQAHHMCKGQSFLQDHELFGEIYSFADSSYDKLVERSIGIGDGNPDLYKICESSCMVIKILDDSFLKTCLDILEETCKEVEGMKYDSGTMNLLQGLSDEAQVFIYKLKRRLA